MEINANPPTYSYAVTIAPSPKTNLLLSRGQISVRCSELLDMVGHYLYNIRRHINIVGVFEMGATRSLHTHFTITFLKPSAQIAFDRSIRWKLDNIGYTNIKPIFDMSNWNTYISKECESMEILGVLPYNNSDFEHGWTMNYNVLYLKRKQKIKVKYPKDEPDRVLTYKITDYAIEWKGESSNSIDGEDILP